MTYTKQQLAEEMRKLQILCEQLNIERVEDYLKISKKINE